MPPQSPLTRRIFRWLPAGLVVISSAGALIALHSLNGMARVTAWYATQLGLPIVSGLVLLTTLIYWLWRKRYRSGACAFTLVTASLCCTLSSLWVLGVVPLRFPASLDRVGPSIDVRLPMDGPIRVAWGGDELEHNYHASTPDQRWAYDLLVAPYLVDSQALEDFGCYGRRVLSPAAGVVTMARDGNADHPPGTFSKDFQTPLGNSVGIRLDETGTFLVLAHLAEGSVEVVVGQHLAEGTLLGLCGNSGNTSEPHVHIHHQRQDPATHTVGFAEGLPLYFHNLDGPAMPTGGLDERDGAPVPIGVVVEHEG